MLGRNKQIFTNYDRNIKFLALSVLSLLFLSFIFLFFHLDQYSNIVMSFIFFILIIMVLVQLREYYLNPQTFEENMEYNPELSIKENPIDFIKGVAWGVKQNKQGSKLQKLTNTFLVILFFLIYGVSTPTRNNLPGFIFLVIVLISVNYVLFYSSIRPRKKNVVIDLKKIMKADRRPLIQRFMDMVSTKENLMIGIINISLLAIFIFWFGVDFDSYFKFLAIGFILILVNIASLSDIKNSKLYE